ncbi:hypothetical protein Poly24_43130 [Rosistilla carotiformis]|uniref:Uncharacterized protein n=1 Tax=Rosistilla carotiformis TaxID=2528017 RepID=A0A518JYH3_9BACT|nr:hypothetical protein Poly24_43130 [Rosistilla carotiformis]
MHLYIHINCTATFLIWIVVLSFLTHGLMETMVAEMHAWE